METVKPQKFVTFENSLPYSTLNLQQSSVLMIYAV